MRKYTQHDKIQATHPFPPIYDAHSRILILGSFPSIASRMQQFYYAHTHNRFWQILYALFPPHRIQSLHNDDKEVKKHFLLQNNIALWDIAQTCNIYKSSDSTIQNVAPNDIFMILAQARIRAIFCNGQKAYQLFMHFFREKIESCATSSKIQVCALPSSSPANARYNLAKLIEEWSIIKSSM